MKQITKITAQRRSGRFNVFVDDEYAFAVSTNVLGEFMLAKGKELTEAQIMVIKQAEQNAKAQEQALSYLSYQPRSIKEIRQYMAKQEVDAETTEVVVKRLIELGYLDDDNFAKLFINNALTVGTDGPRQIMNKLRQKGLTGDQIALHLDEVDPADFIATGLKIVQPMTRQFGRLSQRELLQKMRQKLMQHGFTSELIQPILDAIDLGDDEELQNDALLTQGIKAYKKFKKYSGYEYTRRMKQYLFQHGFSSGEIDRFLNGEIISLEELEEY
ncbi:recombination regulator RecX [Amylolactobacillus amylotrophicus DSM 20534]|uniref:Recombination regulator RecX n=3 Tax=Amylolactobacillus TaxID=2767876 RepID=A0A1L6XD36_9LACO|nr:MULTISPECIES: recombination regulator RecX [Amylolactobacillus]APT18893.1 recombination regulator RecX [Amylolactobacillus amylophilus DSM 20533 = JCM 1125]KRK38851.1 recombination regulator RecX [Amylolactobacillus amylotrophicus DSM 20534]KRM42506.1 recombination regulator RecX [Amylolactobacillus amylophilus DSM 20533 = JCM 1125]GED80074.1 regulatory protein RecX [Amylolactobacillus amylophilus]